MTVTTDWIIGFVLSLTSRVLDAAAAQFWTKAHRERAKETSSEAAETENQLTYIEKAPKTPHREKEVSYVKDPRWLLGLACTVVCAVFDVLSYGYAPASLLAPLASLGLIFNMCLNPIINGESVTRYTIIATLVICGGTVVTVVFSPRGSTNEGHDIGEELENLYISWSFAVFSVITGFSLCALWFTTVRWKDKSTVYSLAVPAISGTLAAVNQILGKGMAIGLKLTFRGDGCFCVQWLWYIILIGILTSWFGEMKWLNRGLVRLSPVHILPIGSTCSILVATLAGLVVFHEADQFQNPNSMILFGLGIATIIGGLIALTQSPESKTDSIQNGKKDDNEDFEVTKATETKADVVSGNRRKSMSVHSVRRRKSIRSQSEPQLNICFEPQNAL